MKNQKFVNTLSSYSYLLSSSLYSNIGSISYAHFSYKAHKDCSDYID